jgi:hypothetical protein
MTEREIFTVGLNALHPQPLSPPEGGGGSVVGDGSLLPGGR